MKRALPATGGSRFDPQIARDFRDLGIDVLQAYGLTETTAAVFANSPRNNVIGSVGPALPGRKGRSSTPARKMADAVGLIAIKGVDRHEGILEPSRRRRSGPARRLVSHRGLRYFDSGGNLFLPVARKK